MNGLDVGQMESAMPFSIRGGSGRDSVVGCGLRKAFLLVTGKLKKKRKGPERTSHRTPQHVADPKTISPKLYLPVLIIWALQRNQRSP